LPTLPRRMTLLTLFGMTFLRFCVRQKHSRTRYATLLADLFSQPYNRSRVPHISLVFREMWDTTALHVQFFRVRRPRGLISVVSHISRKTSEIWGTRPPLDM
jgi:hypothetical protein